MGMGTGTKPLRLRISPLGLVAALIAIAFAGVTLWAQPRTFPLDDAYIHLSYGRNLAFEGTLGLNPGEPSLGTSSPLWAVILVPLFRIFHNPYWGVQAVSLASVVGYVLLATRFVEAVLSPEGGAVSAEGRRFGALCGLLLATNGSLLWMSLSGMETSLVLFLCLASIACYAIRGPGPLLGLMFGIAMLARSTNVAMIVAVLAVEALTARRYRRVGVTMACAAVVYSPYAAYSWHVGRTLFPNTAKGKLVTLVSGTFNPEEWPHYVGRVLAFHKYLPAYFVLLVASLVAYWLFSRGKIKPLVKAMREDSRFALLTIMAFWPIIHVAQYLFAFRTIGQEGRYLAEWLVGIAVVGCCALGYCARRWAAKVPQALQFGVLAALLGLHATTMPYWVSVYRNDVARINDMYVPMMQFIREHTPEDARITSFDIGTLRYLGERYTLDLGGLVDDSTHKCLSVRACGDYVRERHADYVLHPKDPDADTLTGIHTELFGNKYVLRETLVKQTKMYDYSAPTMAHSFRLQLFHIDSWTERGSPAIAAAFAPSTAPNDGGIPFEPASFKTSDLEIVATRIDNRDFRYIREYPYTFTLWIRYRFLRESTKPQWLHVILYDDEGHRVVSAYDGLLTEGAVLPGHFPVGELLEEHHILDVPYDVPAAPPRYHAKVSITDERMLDYRYTQIYPWVDLGMLNVSRSKTIALAPL